jgi:TetR/AcrR family transcriptional regulator
MHSETLSKGDRTAARLREAALPLFAQRGFDGVSMQDVAEAAGVSTPAVHYHFRDKLDLWRAAMTTLRAQIDARADAIEIEGAELDALTQLKLLMRHFVRLSAECPALGRVMMLEGMGGGPRLAWLVRNVFADAYDWQIRLIERAKRAGQIKPYPADQLLILMHAAAATYFTIAPLARAAFDKDALGRPARRVQEDLVIDILFAGLERPVDG